MLYALSLAFLEKALPLPYDPPEVCLYFQSYLSKAFRTEQASCALLYYRAIAFIFNIHNDKNVFSFFCSWFS